MSKIVNRLKEYIDLKGLSIAAFEKSIGMSNASFGRSLKNNGAIGTDKLENILKIYDDINPIWLLTGEGEMLRKNGILNGNPEGEKNTYLNTHLSTHPDEKNAYLNAYPNAYLTEKNANLNANLSEKNTSENDEKYTPEENIQIAEEGGKYTSIRMDSLKTSSFAVPFYDIPVSAGPLGVLTYSWDAIKPDGYIDMEIFRRCDAILPVIGVSMEPEIHSGDLIGIRKLEYYNWEYIETGKVYMIITHEDRMIKYINKADDSEYIVCSSPNYHDFKIRKADVLEVYRVIANIRAL